MMDNHDDDVGHDPRSTIYKHTLHSWIIIVSGSPLNHWVSSRGEEEGVHLGFHRQRAKFLLQPLTSPYQIFILSTNQKLNHFNNLSLNHFQYFVTLAVNHSFHHSNHFLIILYHFIFIYSFCHLKVFEFKFSN